MEERLQKYMASCGVASRRKCEEIILSGKVEVNGKVVTELGVKVNPEVDIVKVDDEIISKEERKVYLMLNKPTNYISSVNDEKGRKTIMDLINVEERVYPIGRLDYDSEGLILLTNDGDIYNKIIHPRENINKVYIADIEGIPSDEDIKKFQDGIDLDGYITSKSKFKILSMYKNTCRVEIIIHEGKNRQIRRMCDAIGYPVLDLMRISVGNIKLDNLKSGEFRYLNEDEIEYLKGL